MLKFQLILYYDLVDLGIVVEEDVMAFFFFVFWPFPIT